MSPMTTAQFIENRLCGRRLFICLLLALVGSTLGCHHRYRPEKDPVLLMARADRALVASLRMQVPVRNIRAESITDTFEASRSGGRTHRAVDIFAPEGTSVRSAFPGVIVSVGENALGGRYVLVATRDSSVVAYYAHLRRIDPRAQVGATVRRGTLLGEVGVTGNAEGTRPHLHFAIWRPTQRGWWVGRNINPIGLFVRDGDR